MTTDGIIFSRHQYSNVPRQDNHITHNRLDAKMMELLILKTARRFSFIIERLFSITNPHEKWPLVFLVLLHHSMQITGEILLAVGPSNAHSFTASAILEFRVHCLQMPVNYIILVLWWRMIDFVVETAQEINNVLFFYKV